MGSHMAKNLSSKGYKVYGFDSNKDNLAALSEDVSFIMT